MWNRATARTAYFLLLMSLLGSGETSRPDAMVNGDPTSASEPSNGPSNDQTPVARLLGKPVYHKDCKSPSYGIGSVEVGFHRLILSVLAQDFCENKGVKLTKDETDAFVERCKMVARKSIQAQRERIERELASPNLALKKKRELEHRKEKLPADGVPLTPPFDRQKEQEKLVAIRRQLDAPNLAWLERFALEGKERTQLVCIEHQSRIAAMAHAQLTPLRCQQALYNRYSGKVVGRPLSIQPIGAQYKLVQEAEKNGKLAFLDEGLKQAFWKRMDNAMRLPTLPARLIDFTWPAWLIFQKARGAENQAKKRGQDSLFCVFVSSTCIAQGTAAPGITNRPLMVCGWRSRRPI